MKIKSIYFYAMLFVIAIYNGSFAEQQSSQFGYVNVVDVLLLHPTMKYYDIGSKRFSLKAFKGINIEERIEENKINIRKEINKLKSNIQELEGKSKELEEIYLERSEHLVESEEELKEMPESERKKYEEKKAELEAKYYNDTDEIRRTIYPIKQKITELEKSSDYSGYSTVEETSQLFSLMLDEVYDSIKEVKKHHNVSFIFNSSAKINNIDFRLDNFFASSNVMEDFFDNYDNTIKESGDSEAKVITGGAISQWLSERESVFKNCNDDRLSDFVIDGGVNLTYEVIDYIYEKHKVGKSQRDFMKDYFDKIIVTGVDGHKDF